MEKSKLYIPMDEFINSLFEQELSYKELKQEFKIYSQTNDYDVYSCFTTDDFQNRDVFQEYIYCSSSLEELRENWLSQK